MLGERFEDALVFAARTHRDQRRKGRDIPYVSHLLAVCSLVIEHGGDEDEAIAALLHDAVEDQGGAAMQGEIERRFGRRVAEIVDACSDTDQQPKPPWRARKEAYIAHLADAPPPVRLVSAADKLHNARTLLEDYRAVGEALWQRFRGGKDGTLWYYGAVEETLRRVGPPPLAGELSRVLAALRALLPAD